MRRFLSIVLAVASAPLAVSAAPSLESRVSRAASGLGVCAQIAQRRGEDLPTAAELRFEIRPDGRTAGVQVGGPPSFVRCVAGRVTRWRFSPTEAADNREVVLPLHVVAGG